MAGFDADTSSYGGYGATNQLIAKATNSPDVANQWADLKLKQQAAQQNQMGISQQQLSMLSNVASSIMADPSPDNAMGRINDAIRMHVIPADEGANELATIAGFGGDQAKIRQYAFDHGQTIATLQQRMDASGMGTPSLVNNGQQQIPMVAQGGLTPSIRQVGGLPIQNQQSPGELAAPRSYTTPDGVTHQTTQAGYQSAVGDPSGGVNNPNSYVDPRRAATARVVNGKIVYGGAPAPVAAVPAAPAAALAPAMPGLAGPAPGIAGAADATAQAGAAMGNALTAAADKATDRRATLSNLQAQLGQLVTSGPNAEAFNSMKAGANAAADIAGLPAGFRFPQQAIASAEEFRKNAQILANQQQQALGGTDAALAAGAHSNPSLDLSPLGNKQVLATLQGNEDAIQVKNQEWQKWLAAGNSPASYPQFAAQLNKTFSPRAFQFAHMDPGQRADMVKTMNPQDRQALAGALATARQNGWINPGGQ